MILSTRSHRQSSGSTYGFLGSLLVALSVNVLPASVSAQYFGRNKVQYETFDFRILKTPHYDIHFYPEEGEAVEDAARMGERWYERFARLFQHEFADRCHAAIQRYLVWNLLFNQRLYGLVVHALPYRSHHEKSEK